MQCSCCDDPGHLIPPSCCCELGQAGNDTAAALAQQVHTPKLAASSVVHPEDQHHGAAAVKLVTSCRHAAAALHMAECQLATY
jgi:hypothetical protein